MYLATTFKNLKHLGSFQLWSREANVIACMQAVSMVNPIVSFDENYNVNSSRGRSTVDKPSFCAKTFKDSSPYSCAWLNIQQPTSTFLSEVGLVFNEKFLLSDFFIYKQGRSCWIVKGVLKKYIFLYSFNFFPTLRFVEAPIFKNYNKHLPFRFNSLI